MSTILTSGVTLLDGAKQTVISKGTGPMTLGGAVAGAQTAVQAGVLTGATVHYRIDDIGNSWEVGTGVLTIAGSVVTVTRTPEASSAGGLAIGLSGSATVSFPALATDFVGSPDYFAQYTTNPANPGWDTAWAAFFSNLAFSNSNTRCSNSDGSNTYLLFSAPAFYGKKTYLEFSLGSTTNVGFGLAGSAARLLSHGGSPRPNGILGLLVGGPTGSSDISAQTTAGGVTLGSWTGFAAGNRLGLAYNGISNEMWLVNVTTAPTTWNTAGDPVAGTGGVSALPALQGTSVPLLWGFAQVPAGSTADIFVKSSQYLGTIPTGYSSPTGL